SRRPTNGLTKYAPAFAASSACAAEKHSVTLTRMPSPDRALHTLMPSLVSGTLTIMHGSIFAMSCPCCIMPAKSVAVTSPLTGPLTMPQIFLRLSRKSPGSLASRVGFVVTPSMIPRSASLSMSLMLPVSTNSFITPPDPNTFSRLPRGFGDACRRRAEVAGLVHGAHGVDVLPASLDAVAERRLPDRRGRDRLQSVGRRDRAQHDVPVEIAFRVRLPDQ